MAHSSKVPSSSLEKKLRRGESGLQSIPYYGTSVLIFPVFGETHHSGNRRAQWVAQPEASGSSCRISLR